ncbi:MAG: NADH-quinone oxidoreductase subunit J [Chloroflexota bacterium]|nr:NADH-quinone oxidoreductase subunit J [Chloroflexota bacterium]
MVGAQDIVFWVLAVVSIAAALGVVVVKDLFRSALLLAVVFIAVAGFFVLLSAEFLAVVQVLIYVGAISVLFIFAIMLTRNVREGNLPNRLQIPAISVSALLLVGMIVAAVNTDWRPIPEAAVEMVDAAQTQAVSGGAGSGSESGSTGIAELLIGQFVLPFEAVSLLLLAALIGGLALARSRGT